MLITLLINWDGFVFSGSDLVAEEMRFGKGWNSTSTTKVYLSFSENITASIVTSQTRLFARPVSSKTYTYYSFVIPFMLSCFMLTRLLKDFLRHKV